MFYFDKHKGKLAVRHERDLFTEPVRMYMWWPVLGYRGDFEGAIDGEAVQDMGGGMFRHWRTKSEAGIDPNGQPFDTHELPIPPPKTRGLPVRWHNGEWQKLTKAKGWVSA